MTDLSEKRLADLTLLIDVSRQLGATSELVPLLKSIEQVALTILDCERASVFLYDRATQELFSKVATGVEELRFRADRGIAGESAQTRRTINVPDAYADPRFNPAVDKVTGFHTRNILTLVMTGYDGDLMGVLQLLNKRRGAFTPDDERSAETLAALAGVALQRQVLLEEFAHKQKLERDLDLAREIQRDYLPRSNPVVSGFDVAGWNKPADQTGGDAYDFIPLTEGRLGLLICDATGHGIGPALMVAECRALIRGLVTISDDVYQVMSRTNTVLAQDLKDGRFVTACYCVLDPSHAALEYLSAGQGPLVWYQANRDEFVEFPADTVPLGLIPELEHPPLNRLVLQPGDIFMMLTDGFSEWSRSDGEQFGLGRVCDVIRSHRHQSCREMIDLLHQAAMAFAGGVAQPDDLTALIIKRTDS